VLNRNNLLKLSEDQLADRRPESALIMTAQRRDEELADLVMPYVLIECGVDLQHTPK